MTKLKPSAPPFQAKAKKGGTKKTASVPAEAPVAPPAPSLPPAEAVTAGPFHDDREGWNKPAWTVITRWGGIYTYHRFKTQELAEEFKSAMDASR
jgi:hypothetical protein